VARRQARYDLAKAASRIVGRLNSRSLIIFTQDATIGRDEIAGYYLVNWRLWKLIRENGIELHIFATGRKFAAEFDLTDRTIHVGNLVEHLRCRWQTLRQSPKSLDIVEKKMVDLLSRTLEPLYYVYRYTAKRRHIPSRVIIATGESQIFAGIIIKHLFGLKLVYLEHDARLLQTRTRSLFAKVYYLAYTYALRHADLVLTISNTMRKEFLNSCSFDEDRLMVIWSA